jgi:DNA-directed RNA polymerase specialized sigma24 family protein
VPAPRVHLSPASAPTISRPTDTTKSVEASLRLNARTFDARYGELLSDLLRVCRSLGAGHDAEDIAQEVLIYGRTHLHALRDDAKLKPWLRRIAVRWTLRHARDVKSTGDAADVASTLGGVDLLIDERAAISALSPRQRQVVALVYIAGFRQDEVGEMLSISRGTVARTLWDARCSLAAALVDYRTGRR